MIREAVAKLLVQVARGGGILHVPQHGWRGPFPAQPEVAHAFTAEGTPARPGVFGRQYHLVPEFFYQFSGCNVFGFSEAELPLQAGEMLVMPPRLAHSERIPGDPQAFQMLVLWFFHGQMGCAVTEASAQRIPMVIYNETYAAEASRPLLELLNLIVATDGMESALRREAVNGLLLTFLLHWQQVLEHEPQIGGENPKIVQVRRLVLARLEDPTLSVLELAAELGCSADYLSALFRRETGQRLLAFIAEKRLAQAALLMAQSNLPLKAIAAKCGFRSQSYFGLLFRRHYEVRPGDYLRGCQRRAP